MSLSHWSHAGRIVWEEGFGWANRETGVKATPHTPFSMASITKPFTATTIMTLVAEGKLSLDEAANQYLADSKIIGTNGNAKAATVRLLGAHASGLPGIYESYEAEEAKLVPTPDAVMQAYGRLAYPPATCYEYSNIGFAALNAIASALTQTEFGELMHQRVLAPLGLNDSFFGSDIRSSAKTAPAGTTREVASSRTTQHRRPPPASCMPVLTISPASLIFNMGHRDQGQAAILSEHDLDEITSTRLYRPLRCRDHLWLVHEPHRLWRSFLISKAEETRESPTGCASSPRKTWPAWSSPISPIPENSPISVIDELITNSSPTGSGPTKIAGLPANRSSPLPHFKAVGRERFRTTAQISPSC